MPFRLHHIHLICSDLETTIAFFTDAFGARLSERKKFGAADGAVLDLNGTTINLRVARENEQFVKDPSIATYGYNHIGFEVKDLQAAYRELSQKGIVFSVPPKESGGHLIAFLKGPDDIIIELLQAG